MSPSIHEIYPDVYMAPADLEGKEQTFKIVEAKRGAVYNTRTNKKEPKLILTFENEDACMVLNKTQAIAVARFLKSDDYSTWVGCSIKIKPAQAHNKKATILVSAGQRPQAAKPAAAQKPNQPKEMVPL